MIYDTKEYNVKLEIPTDNFVFYNLYPKDITNNLDTYILNLKQNILNNNTLIILFGGFQNLHEFDYLFDRFNILAKEIPNPIIVFNGRLTANLLCSIEPLFKYCRICMFDHVSNINMYLTSALDTEKKYKCYWASSKDLYPRRFILAGLIKHNLLDASLVNYKCIHSHIPSDWLINRFDNQYIEIIKQECDSIDHLIPLPWLDDTVEFNCTDPEFYTNSYLGVVTDTFYHDGIFLSEKVFNAINYYQLFFYIGPAGSLKYLRNEGYYTFDSIIDTSYDSIENNAERLFASRKSLIEFLDRPIDRIRDDYIKCIPELKHNKDLVQSRRPDLLVTQHIQDLLNEHRKTHTNFS